MKNQFSQLISIVLLFLIIVGALAFVLPLREKLATLKGTREGLQADLFSLEAEYSALETLAAEVSTSETTRETLLKAVPIGFSQDDLILDLSEMATGLDFTLNAVNFSDTVSEEYGKTMDISINLSGPYGEMILFLQKLESAERLLRITGINIQRTSDADIAFNLRLEAYYQ